MMKFLFSLKSFYSQVDSIQEIDFVLESLLELNKDAPIVDFGCGNGRISLALQTRGFTNIIGIEANDIKRRLMQERGFTCLAKPEELKASMLNPEVLILSHVIEHLNSDQILSLMSTLDYPKRLIIITPLFIKEFFNDPDHIRPYPPISMRMLLSATSPQIKAASKRSYSLVSLRFKKSPFREDISTGRSLKSYVINTIYLLLYLFSYRIISRQTAWMGVFNRDI